MSRSVHIDNAKGVLIILVLLGHLVWPIPNPDQASNTLYLFIYFFHMPMFALISGYLSHESLDRDRVVGSMKQLLVPYLMFIGIQWGILTLAGKEPWPLHEGHYGLWFLLSLFCWRMLLPLVMKLPSPLLITIIASLVCGAIPQVGLEFSLARTINFLPFFLAGHLIRTRQASPVDALKRPMAFAFLALAAGTAAYFSKWNVYGLFWGGFSYQSLHLPLMIGPAARAIQIFMAFVTGLAALSLVPMGESVLTRIGRHSLHVYLLHTPLLAAYRIWPETYGIMGSQPLLMIPAALLLAWVLSSEPVVLATRRLVSPL